MNNNQNINEPELLEESSSVNSVPISNNANQAKSTDPNPQQPQIQSQINMTNNFQQPQPQINIPNNIQSSNQNINYNGLNNGNVPPQNFNNISPSPPQPKKSNTGLIIVVVVMILVGLLFIFGVLIAVSVFFTTASTVNLKNHNEIIEKQDEYNNLIEDDKLEENIKVLSSKEFSLAGVNYKLDSSYKDLTQNGWYVDFARLGYKDGYILNAGDKTYSTTSLQNQNFPDADVNIGFINIDTIAKDATECNFWAINVDNTYSDTPVSFSLPGGIKNGSTLEEIEKIYGKPKEEDIYRSDLLKYTEYRYEYDYTIYLDLIIYDDGGLMEFDYKKY